MQTKNKDVLILQVIFQTLSDITRLGIVRALGEKEMAVSEIVSITGLSQPLVSHHLRLLRNSHILDTRRKGPFIYYYVKEKKILEIIDQIVSLFQEVSIEYIGSRLAKQGKVAYRLKYQPAGSASGHAATPMCIPAEYLEQGRHHARRVALIRAQVKLHGPF